MWKWLFPPGEIDIADIDYEISTAFRNIGWTLFIYILGYLFVFVVFLIATVAALTIKFMRLNVTKKKYIDGPLTKDGKPIKKSQIY
jgi:hypothetical protein